MEEWWICWYGEVVMGSRLRGNDVSNFVSFKTVIPAQAGTHTTHTKLMTLHNADR